jgi:hypothetical protein
MQAYQSSHKHLELINLVLTKHNIEDGKHINEDTSLIRSQGTNPSTIKDMSHTSTHKHDKVNQNTKIRICHFLDIRTAAK